METSKLIVSQHGEHAEWLNKLTFYKDDLKIWQRRLDEVAGGNTNRDAMAELEKFQNQQKIQQEQIDILMHNIREKEDVIQKSIKDNPVASDHRKTNGSDQLRSEMTRFEELYAEFRKNLMNYLSKWM